MDIIRTGIIITFHFCLSIPCHVSLSWRKKIPSTRLRIWMIFMYRFIPWKTSRTNKTTTPIRSGVFSLFFFTVCLRRSELHGKKEETSHLVSFLRLPFSWFISWRRRDSTHFADKTGRGRPKESSLRLFFMSMQMLFPNRKVCTHTVHYSFRLSLLLISLVDQSTFFLPLFSPFP